MYTVPSHSDVILHQLHFERSPPFGDLIRELFRLFASFTFVNQVNGSGRMARVQDPSNAKKLRDCRTVIRLMENVLERVDWPKECDRPRVTTVLAMRIFGPQNRVFWFTCDRVLFSLGSIIVVIICMGCTATPIVVLGSDEEVH